MKLEQEEEFEYRYEDVVRLVEKGDVHRVGKLHVDLNQLAEGKQPFIFYAIKKKDVAMVKLLLDREVDIKTKHQVNIDALSKEEEDGQKEEISKQVEETEVEQTEQTESDSPGNWAVVDAEDYARIVGNEEIVGIIQKQKLEVPASEQFIRSAAENDLRKMKSLIKKKRIDPSTLNRALLTASKFGHPRMIHHLLTLKDVDINSTDDKGDTPLHKAIQYGHTEAAKFLVFQGSDIHKQGQFGGPLVAALHFDSHTDVITLLLEKGADLAERHKHWPNLSLREYCVQESKVKAKAAIDSYVIKLIELGKYAKLKSLTERGYTQIDVMNRLRKSGRQIASERYHDNIVQLMDQIAEENHRISTKMNY